ncbi:THUMP domain-containing class I SAM-dependent RNA methyltransferase [Haliscomenobacter hydrossis]|uniref:rRNA (Guanine-N(2)-)-methyltransferase n=1 Tax=Haliscomenobacter hydrossis (strain ATCC 27775 / DSM 1100 / LMG 10767 / O) TaxID=760192 RepID=F4KSY8_HALH1|nr:THUMP domain-containing protein [Haliscomenobacter hydrossis]AEE49095.1 rRNA (guanine-N(2)-)-methyltransferase [Haliscomenobacter hydrossis DSM 1100]
MNFIAKTLAGLEPVLIEELKILGAENIRLGKRAVFYEGEIDLMYQSNLELRTALRILVPIGHFKVRNEDDLYHKIGKFDWSEYMSVDDTLAVDAVTSSSLIRHSKFAALRTKDAIVDQFRKKFGRRPDVNTESPTLRLNLHIGEDDVTLALDSSGESLHRRGYRVDSVEAPINEVLAAGMILLSGWECDCDFIDPMCGSGTLPIEAAMLAYNIPPQINRPSFAFMRWENFDKKGWEKVREEAILSQVVFQHKIFASDIDFKAVNSVGYNIEKAGLEGKIQVSRERFENVIPSSENGLLMMNPPYDERMELEDGQAFYKSLGDTFKKNWAGHSAWIISSNLEAVKALGLRPSRRIPLFNGKLECRLLRYDMYAGSKRVREEREEMKEDSGEIKEEREEMKEEKKGTDEDW